MVLTSSTFPPLTANIDQLDCPTHDMKWELTSPKTVGEKAGSRSMKDLSGNSTSRTYAHHCVSAPIKYWVAKFIVSRKLTRLMDGPHRYPILELGL